MGKESLSVEFALELLDEEFCAEKPVNKEKLYTTYLNEAKI